MAFEREKQNSPIDPERCEWPEDYFDERIWYRDKPAGTLKVIVLDPTAVNHRTIGRILAQHRLRYSDSTWGAREVVNQLLTSRSATTTMGPTRSKCRFGA
ncbi:MAG: hypothetical protein H0T51_01250 [Pirellulales bacterium]|nr:hypothetical protein [Pirellulales bacterium]